MGMCRCEGYGFQTVYSRIGYINQSVWVQNRVSFFRKLISQLKIFSDLCSIWKMLLLQDRGDLGSYSSIGQQNSAQLLALVQVKGSQWQIPTQKFLKYSPAPPREPVVVLPLFLDRAEELRYFVVARQCPSPQPSLDPPLHMVNKLIVQLVHYMGFYMKYSKGYCTIASKRFLG